MTGHYKILLGPPDDWPTLWNGKDSYGGRPIRTERRESVLSDWLMGHITACGQTCRVEKTTTCIEIWAYGPCRRRPRARVAQTRSPTVQQCRKEFQRVGARGAGQYGGFDGDTQAELDYWRELESLHGERSRWKPEGLEAH